MASDGSHTMRDANLTGYTPKATPGVTPEEILPAHSRVVTCDGGGGALGHPAVSLRIEATQVTCPYCSRTYVLQDGAGGDDHH
ncbi:zinc-finger domain-containing protein [Teichococcus aestuarii]